MIASAEADECIESWSLIEESWREALAERWIRSVEAGYDVGDRAIRNWVHRHWPGFLRARWIEHMQGIRYWSELDRNEFGILKKTPGEHLNLLNEIIEQLRCGAENLDILCWMRRNKKPEEQNIIRQLLMLINVNAHRMRCHFSDD